MAARAHSTGEDLYRIVCEYAALGHHRSGTDRDTAATEWFVELMSDLGDVTTAPVEFDRYEASSELTVDGRPLEHLRREKAGEHAEAITEAIARDYGPVEHPLVRTHPETGKRALLYAEGFVSHVAAVSRAESDMVLNFLREHVAEVSLHCRWQWQNGDLARSHSEIHFVFAKGQARRVASPKLGLIPLADNADDDKKSDDDVASPKIGPDPARIPAVRASKPHKGALVPRPPHSGLNRTPSRWGRLHKRAGDHRTSPSSSYRYGDDALPERSSATSVATPARTASAPSNPRWGHAHSSTGPSASERSSTLSPHENRTAGQNPGRTQRSPATPTSGDDAASHHIPRGCCSSSHEWSPQQAPGGREERHGRRNRALRE